MKILLLGYGLSNKAIYNYFKNDEVTIIDESNYKYLKKDDYYFDYLFLSPYFKNDNPIFLKLKNKAKMIDNEISYALKILKHKHVISVSGSDGKTSLVKLINHVFNKVSTCAYYGNMGRTLIDKLLEAKNKEYIVIEYSSNQLNMNSATFEIGILKNLHPNHLNYYNNINLYYKDKFKLFDYSNKILINKKYNKHVNNKEKIINPSFYQKNKLIYDVEGNVILNIKNLKYQDSSFIENVIFVLELMKYYHLDYSKIEEYLLDYEGVKYRLEDKGYYKNIHFINDGKSSTSSSSAYAYNLFKKEKCLLILGGIHKSSPFAFKVKKNDEVFIYGISANKIKKELKKGKVFKTLHECLDNVNLNDKKVIIYSPGCSSFDQYSSFLERSIEFDNWVNKWIN